jgi:hypothetical protein
LSREALPIIDKTLQSLEYMLNRYDKSLADFPSMPKPERSLTDGDKAARLRQEYVLSEEDRPEELQRFQSVYHANFNADQLFAFNAITDAVNASLEQRTVTSNVFFLNAPGGSGKSFVLDACTTYYRSKGVIILVAASTGIAAINLRFGMTAHRLFHIPLDCGPDGVCSLSKQSAMAKLIVESKAILWDEITMQHLHAVEAVDRLLRDLQDDAALKDKPFGGKVNFLLFILRARAVHI